MNTENITEVYIKEEIDEFMDPKTVIQSSMEKCECDDCGAKLSSDKILQKHKKYAHSGKYYSYDKCNFKGKQTLHLYEHKKRIHEGIRHQCKECGIEASTKSSLKVHIRSKHTFVLQYCSTAVISVQPLKMD